MATAWEYLNALSKYDGSETAHRDVIATLKAHGHTVKVSDAWCTETQMAALYDCGAVGLVGGYAADAAKLKSNAVKKGIWHSGSSGILPGDIVIFGSGGKANHTEACVGYQVDVSGNYKGGCSRRSYKGRNVLGYIRPKWAVKDMDNLQVTIEAANCMLNVYGSGDIRKKMLSVFGTANAEKIQAEIDRVWDSMDRILFDFAVYVIAGHAGKDSYRRKRLGGYAERVQDKIDEIYALRGKSVNEAAQLVIAGRFGTNAVRSLLLEFCGYNAQQVQSAVNKALEIPKTASSGSSGKVSIVSLFRDAERPTKDVDGLQGNCIIFRDPAKKKILGVDSMKAGALDRIKAELSGYDHVEWLCTHPHSDHMGTNINSLVKAGIIKKLYLPQRSTIVSNYLARFDALVKQCEKSGTQVVYLKQGDTFDVGGIHGKVIFQQLNTDSVNMRSLCLLFEAAGKRILYCGDHHCGMKESLLKAENIGHVDIFIGSHHQLYTGDTDNFVRKISPDWIIGPGWKSWPIGTVGQDAKVKAAQAVYQKYGNLLPGDIVGRTELSIEDGIITAKGEKNMAGKAVKYSLGGKTYQKMVYVCGKCTFRKVQSMLPAGAKVI